MKPLLEAKQIKKSFKRPIPSDLLKGIDLQVYPGESIAIIGRSGEGKSTLLQILGTLEDPTEGSLKILDREVSFGNKALIRNQHIGFVFQSFHLLEDYTALENVLMPAKIARRSVSKNSEMERRALSLLDQVGLKERAHYHTKYLSGGEKQRVALARALCNNPSLLLADEPSGNLDRQTASIIHEKLFGVIQDKQRALIIVTHDRELAKLCTKQYELRGGILLELL